MKLFPDDPDVELYETGFEGDQLERGKFSKQLSELLDKLESPTVLALDDRWGTGKTYFLKRWVAAHTKENDCKSTTVYFDAFENDYLSDPLVSIISAVVDRFPDSETALKKWKSAAKKLIRPGIGIAASLATFGAARYLDDIGDAVAEAVGAEVKNAANDIWAEQKAKTEALETFKAALVDLTTKSDAALVIVVDELDRCRPDYALSVLEIIKHLFAVPNVHFILGVNGNALQSSVKARYGADIDAQAYLRKFINASFSLPKFHSGQGKGEFLLSYARDMGAQMELPEKILNRTVTFLGYVAAQNDVSLRDVGKILSHIALVPTSASERNVLEGWTDVLCILLVTSQTHPDLHQAFLDGELSEVEISNFLGITKDKMTETTAGNYNKFYVHDLKI